MLDRLEHLRPLAAHRLGRRLPAHQMRVRLLQGRQLRVEHVVLGIRQGRRIVLVVGRTRRVDDVDELGPACARPGRPPTHPPSLGLPPVVVIVPQHPAHGPAGREGRARPLRARPGEAAGRSHGHLGEPTVVLHAESVEQCAQGGTGSSIRQRSDTRRRHDARQDADTRLEGQPEVLVDRIPHQGKVDAHELRPRRAQERYVRVLGTAVHARDGARVGDAGEDVTEHPLRHLRVDRTVRRQPARRADATGQDRGQAGLVELHDDGRGARQPPAHIGHVADDRLPQGLGDVPCGRGIAQGPLPRHQLDGRRQRPRTGDLDLDGAVVPDRRLLEGVEVLPEEGHRPSHLPPKPRREAPAVRSGLEPHPRAHRRQQSAGPPDDVGPGSPGGELGDMQEARQLAGDDPGGLQRRRAGHGAHPGGGGGRPGQGHRPDPARSQAGASDVPAAIT